ncbi:MAG: hypothetical protein WA130_11595 [Candidatus Methanoperedens sp.]
MSNLGVFASRFEINSKTLKEFDEALQSIKKRTGGTQTREANKSLLNVLEPITERLKGNLSTIVVFNEGGVTDILKERHNRDWPTYKEKLLKLNNKLKLNSENPLLTGEDFQILEDIADAIDAECENLFQRMSERY